jgi:hypothetical protein
LDMCGIKAMPSTANIAHHGTKEEVTEWVERQELARVQEARLARCESQTSMLMTCLIGLVIIGVVMIAVFRRGVAIKSLPSVRIAGPAW